MNTSIKVESRHHTSYQLQRCENEGLHEPIVLSFAFFFIVLGQNSATLKLLCCYFVHIVYMANGDYLGGGGVYTS